MLDSGAQNIRSKLSNLDHHRGHPVIAPFRVGLSLVNEGGLSRAEGATRTVGARNPTRPLHWNEELPETGRVRPDYAAALEPHHERVRFTSTVS